uniref:Uncharacterized protein n=1 Tax=Anguilla anguilla TaxID=7936 RepID=A0A0E9UHK3_ANGAN
MIPLPINYPYNNRNNSTFTYYIPMMTRHCTRRDFPRTPYTASTKRITNTE